MPIGEFGGAPPLVAEGSPALTTPMYWMYEMGHASLNPARAVTDATKILFQNPLNPWSHTQFGKSIAAACELFERTTRRYGKTEWGLDTTEINGVRTPVEVRSIWEKPFCRLLYFDRKLTRPLRSPQPRVLIVAPMSGHYATLLRGTVEAFLPAHEVYITDWADARMVPVTEGRSAICSQDRAGQGSRPACCIPRTRSESRAVRECRNRPASSAAAACSTPATVRCTSSSR